MSAHGLILLHLCSLRARAVAAICRVFCCRETCSLCILRRNVFTQLPHGLQLAPVIAAKSRMRRSIADQVLVHAVGVLHNGVLGTEGSDPCTMVSSIHKCFCDFMPTFADVSGRAKPSDVCARIPLTMRPHILFLCIVVIIFVTSALVLQSSWSFLDAKDRTPFPIPEHQKN